MKFSRAYTLQEVIITLAIVGIIAALVVPGFSNSMHNKAIGTQLSKAVSLLQNSMSEILQYPQIHSDTDFSSMNLAALRVEDLFENAPDGYNLNDNIAEGQNLLAITGGIIGAEQTDVYDINAIRNYDGTAPEQNLLSDCETYQFKKNKSIIIFQDIPNLADNISDEEVITRVIIDANSTDAPNKFGEDVFLFGLTNAGLLVPAGSQAYNNNVFGEELDLYTQDCQDDITTGLSCAARVMADGWKIEY